jgi:YidC/Oxa1 family membrane protein insertase
LLEVCFIVLYKIYGDVALSIIGLSVVVTICTLPLYYIAESWQKKERETQARLKPKIDKIKAVFRGDEQYMMLTAYYRQNHYHPVYTLRATLGLLIQIPFFIAAYSYLSHPGILQNGHFLFIKNMGSPDALINMVLGGKEIKINILPFIMAIVNCISGFIYTKGFPLRDKLQLYGLTAVFLVLLYNSPSGLVFYWTMNNIFSLIKNILTGKKHAKKIIYFLFCICVVRLYADFIPQGFSPKRFFVLLCCSIVFFAPLIYFLYKSIKNKLRPLTVVQNTILEGNKTYILSLIILFLLAGLVIPGMLISSSVEEFSFVDSYTTPLPFLFNVMLQSTGVFLFWPLCIYFLFPKHIRRRLTFFLALVTVYLLADTFIFPGDFGILTTTFKFTNSDTLESQYKLILTSTLCFLVLLPVIGYMLLSQKRKILFRSFQVIILFALSALVIINLVKINSEFQALAERREAGGNAYKKLEPVYTLTRTGKNVVLIMLDRAISGYVPYIFEEKPELHSEFDGFVLYPNNISFGSHTRVGSPPIFGGYEYIPSLIHKNRSLALKKNNEALLVLPKLFSDAQYSVTVTDPPFANYSLVPDLSIFNDYPEIHRENLTGKYTGLWIKEHPEVKIISTSYLFKNLLLRFSFLKIAPPPFRVFLYDKGEWLMPDDRNGSELPANTIDSYTALEFLPEITRITADDINMYIAMESELTHSPAFLQAPDYVPVTKVTDRGSGHFAGENHYHVNMAAMLLLGKWFAYLQQNDAYDNTRIIIVSDHGIGLNSDFPNNIRLPDGSSLEAYNSVLMVKDFNEKGKLKTDDTFMTTADVPLIASGNLIDNAVNPFTKQPFRNEKENGVTITSSSVSKFSINDDEWMYVHDNIFDPANWKAVRHPAPADGGRLP